MARILLIDDEEMLREVYAELLDEAGHQTLQAATGIAGIEAIRSARPDLVLPRHHFRAAMSLGADDYLAKPVSESDLVAAVEARLARRAAERREAERRADEIRRSVTFLLPHELRTPLTVILGGSQMIQELHQEMAPDEIREMATTVFKAAQRLHRMAENYLLHVGIELERLSSAESSARALSGVAGADVVRDAASAQAREYGREQDVRLELADATVPVAEAYLRKIVSELVDNALKFSEAGRAIKVSLTAADERVTLAVSDAGRGMTLDQIGEVGAFRQFHRAVFEQQGSGLGLILVKEIVEASGGSFDLRSGVGEGTTVSVAWPT